MPKISAPIFALFSKVNRLGSAPSFPFVILLSIVAYEVMKINLQVIFKESHGNTSLFGNFWTLASVIGSTLLGFLSDRFFIFSWRKPICLIGIVCSLVTGIAFLHPAFHDASNTIPILFFVLLNGLSGSYLGAARAFYLDHFPKDKVFYFSITVIFQCLPWICIGELLAEEWITHSFLHGFSIGMVALALCTNLFFVGDQRQPQYESRHGGTELKELTYKYNNVRDWSIISSFFILSLSYHLMPYLGEYTFTDAAFYQELFLLGLGLTIGVPLAFAFLKMPTLRALKIGYAVCFLYFLALGLLYQTNLMNSEKTLKYQFLIFALFGGALWILSLKEFLIKSKPTEGGLVLGFIESVQSLGEFAGAILSTFLASSVMVKRAVNVRLFLILLASAFTLVSLESFLKYLKRDH